MTEGIAEPQPEKVNPFQRIAGVLFSPGETFASIARRPDFVVPLVIILILSAISGVLIASRVDFVAMTRSAMEANPKVAQMPAEQLDRMVSITAGFTKAATYASPLISIIVLVIIAGVLFLAFRMFGGTCDFHQAFAVTCYSWMPGLIKGILGLIVLMNRASSLTLFDLQNPIRSNLAFLYDPIKSPVAYALSSSIDLFTIWMLVLYIIGFAAASRLSKARSAAIVISLWLVAVLIKLIGPALQALRAKS